MASEVADHKLGRKAFRAWIEATRKRFQGYLDMWSAAGKEEGGGIDSDENVKIFRLCPVNDLNIEWVYTIDLDHYIFWIDNKPVFTLVHMPKEDNFTRNIGEG